MPIKTVCCINLGVLLRMRAGSCLSRSPFWQRMQQVTYLTLYSVFYLYIKGVNCFVKCIEIFIDIDYSHDNLIKNTQFKECLLIFV